MRRSFARQSQGENNTPGNEVSIVASAAEPEKQEPVRQRNIIDPPLWMEVKNYEQDKH